MTVPEYTLNMTAHSVCHRYSRSLCNHADRCVHTVLEYTVLQSLINILLYLISWILTYRRQWSSRITWVYSYLSDGEREMISYIYGLVSDWVKSYMCVIPQRTYRMFISEMCCIWHTVVAFKGKVRCIWVYVNVLKLGFVVCGVGTFLSYLIKFG